MINFRFLILLPLLFILALPAQSQGRTNKAITQDVSLVSGAAVVYTDSILFNSAVTSLTLELAVVEVAGDGGQKIVVQGSVSGTSWVTLANFNNHDWISLFATDTTAVANNGNEYLAPDGGGACAFVFSVGSPFKYARAKISAGAATDTVNVTPNYIIKK